MIKLVSTFRFFIVMLGVLALFVIPNPSQTFVYVKGYEYAW